MIPQKPANLYEHAPDNGKGLLKHVHALFHVQFLFKLVDVFMQSW